MPLPTPRRLALLTCTVLTLGLAACGDDDSSDTAGNGTDLAFVRDMTPHHESAVEMAKIAQERSKRPEIRRLAADIIRTQNQEIRVFGTVRTRLTEAGQKPADLGMSHEDMGMDMDAAQLRTAKPFDREFLDMMIPHHQGAIRMAHVELAKGGDPAVQALAEDIITAQAREIDRMNRWRKAWYGAKSPTGGVPKGSTMPDMPGMP